MRKFLLSASLLLVSIPSPAQVAGENATTVEVRGTVRDAISGRILPRGSVQIGETYTPVDIDGRFKFEGVAPGRQLLTASRASYLLAGIRKPGANQSPAYRDTGVYVSVPSETPFEIVVYMYPSPAVSGTVVDTTGQPVEGVAVSSYRFTYDKSGERTLTRGRGFSTTDDRGEFVLDSLVPGEYIFRVGNDLIRKSIVPTYYPGSLDFSKAETVVVRAGDDIRLRRLVLQDAPLVSVYTRLAVEAGDEIPVATVAVRRKGESGELSARGSLLKLPPGFYEVEGIASMRSTATLTNVTGARAARTSIEVRDTDITLPMTIPNGTSTAIRVLQERAGELKAVPDLSILLVSKDYFSVRPLSGTTSADGSFTLTSVPTGTYRVSLPLSGETEREFVDNRALPTVSPNLCFGELRQNETADLDDEVRIGGSSATISVFLRESTTLIQGKVVDRAGAPSADATIAIVPDDRKQGRGYAATIADQDGNFEFKCAPPGGYRLYAWTTLPGAAYRNEEFMAKYQGQGTAVRVEEGFRSTVQATVIDP